MDGSKTKRNPSAEETDLLSRSKKKMKRSANGVNTDEEDMDEADEDMEDSFQEGKGTNHIIPNTRAM